MQFVRLYFVRWADLYSIKQGASSLERKKRKWVDFLMRKGYESHLVFEFLKEVEKD